jgi:uncharacterized protein
MREQLMKDLKQSMLDKDELRKNTIVLLRSEILRTEKDKQITLTEEQVSEIVAKEIKKRNEAIPSFEKAERLASVEALKREVEILTQYLPKQLTEEELLMLIKDAIVLTDAKTFKDMGKVMKELRPKIMGRADNKQVSQIIDSLLA